MSVKLGPEIKVGLFVLVTILILVYATVKVGDQSVVSGGGYQLITTFDTVSGLNAKAPIELAGVGVGLVKKVELHQGRAQVSLLINKNIKLAKDTQAFLRIRGFLGDAFIELIPGDPEGPLLQNGDFLENSMVGGDVDSLVNQFGTIAGDVKEITETARYSTMPNLDKFVEVMHDLTLRNEKNFDKIAQNLAALSERLREMVDEGGDDVEDSMERIASIATKIDEGSGTFGRLVNDESTVNKINTAVDGLNKALGGFSKWEMELGYHTEYLTSSKDYKHYVSFGLKPSPDKAFLLDVVQDSNPDTKRSRKITQITSGGTTSTVTTNTEILSQDSFLVSAQLAKSFYDLTLRGGIIESKGGLGLDYDLGPLTMSFSAYDFESQFGEKPHLKFASLLNVTENFYLTGGFDDPLNTFQNTDYFFGAGFRLVDEDIKSLIKLGSLAK